jgi:hypothetical protein
VIRYEDLKGGAHILVNVPEEYSSIHCVILGVKNYENLGLENREYCECIILWLHNLVIEEYPISKLQDSLIAV